MRKGLILATILVAIIVLGISVTTAAVPTKTITNLGSQDQGNAWVIMALKAAGQSVSATSLSVSDLSTATTIERTILGVVAGGEDPNNFKNTNLVSLLDAQRNNGQIGDQALLNDDIWGILAYTAAGITASDSRIDDSEGFILSQQNSDGGFGFAVIADSDSNDTAMAIVALIRAGVSSSDARITNAINYLKTTQNDDGGIAISPGSDSDSASTSWAISALQSVGVDPNTWTKGSNNPFTYLQTTAMSDGSYKWKTSDSSGNPMMTSYAAIALAGTSYPVTTKTTTPTETKTKTSTLTDFRIEGSQGQLCAGAVEAANALDLVEKASALCNFSYVIEDTDWGPYLKQIGYDEAAGMSGWMYLVNWQSPMVGAVDYELTSTDFVTWFYGEFDRKPLRLKVLDNSTVLVEVFDDPNWQAVSGATVKYNNTTKTTNSLGKATIALPEGNHAIYAEKDGYIRSNIESIKVGSGMSTTVPLQTTVVLPAPPPPPPIPEPEISFVVDVVSSSSDQMTFGSLQPGQSNSQTMTLKNTGNVSLGFTATVNGDQLFVDYLQLDSAGWNNFAKELSSNQQSNVDVSLAIPSNYNSAGVKSGELIFWATP